MRRPSSWEALRSTDLTSTAPAELAGAVGAFMEAHGKPVSDKARVQWASNWRQWKLFTDRHGLAPFPLSMAALRAYKLECDVRGLRYETVGRYRQTLADIHDMMGVAFIWSATDVAGPLGADLKGGRSAVAIHDEPEPSAKKPPASRRVRRAAPQPDAGPTASASPVHDGNEASATAGSQDDMHRTKPEGPGVDVHAIWSLAWCLDACHLLTRTLSHIITSGEERRVDEVIQLSKVLRYAEYVALGLERLVPAPFRANLTTRVAPFELAQLAREMRGKLTEFMANGAPKTLEQVEAVGGALTQLCARDVESLERIYPPTPQAAATPGSSTAGSDAAQAGDVGQRAMRLRHQLNQIALEVEKLKNVTSRLIPTESSMTSGRQTATATTGTTR